MSRIFDKAKTAARTVPGLRSLVQTLSTERSLREKKHRAMAEAAAIFNGRGTVCPILIYQMAKVGSATVYESLKRLELPNPIVHIHFIAPSHVAEMKQRYARAVDRARIPYNLFLGEALAQRIQASGTNREYKVITLVRDPIARDVSGIFQAPELRDPHVRQPNGDFDVQRCVRLLADDFSRPTAGSYPDNWFDREIKATFGIDVFDFEFDTERGYQIISHENVKLLVLRLEDLNTSMGRGLAEFLDFNEEVPCIRANERDRSANAATYDEVKRRLRIPRAQCERIYARKVPQHFYRPAMIRTFIEKWSGDSGQAVDRAG